MGRFRTLPKDDSETTRTTDRDASPDTQPESQSQRRGAQRRARERRRHRCHQQLQGLVKKDPRCPEVGLGTPKPTSGHQELQRDASSKDTTASKITTIGTPKKRNPKPTSGHQELVGDPRARRERTKSRSKNMRRRTYSAARTETMQNQCFSKGPIHTSNSKVSSKDRRCPEVKLGIPKPTSGHQELRSRLVSRGRIRNS